MSKYTSLSDIQAALKDGSTTMVDVVQSYLQRIKETNHLNIYVEVYEEEAFAKAKELDRKLEKDPSCVGGLFGAVASIKDVLCYKDHKLTAASNILGSFTSQFTATAVQRLLDEDVIIIGRTNCDEFAMGSTNEHTRYGPTLNGLDESRVPGGSSGAAAVSVERDTCLIGVGSDTGGSVRQPAAFCGIYGMKPTYGRISRYGLIAYGSSFDQIGLLTKDVDTLSRALTVMSGPDPMDATCLSIEAPAIASADQASKYKIAYIPEVLNHPGLKPEIKKGCEEVIENLKEQGHGCEAIDFDLLSYLVPTYYVLTTAEASSNLSRYDGIRYGLRADDVEDLEELYERSRSEGFGTEVKRRIMMGTFVLSVGYFDAYFTKAQQVRTLIIQRLTEVFSKFDFIVMPTTTDIAWPIGEMIKDPVSMYLADVYTVLANLGGYPAISIPKSSEGLDMPFGIQVMSDKCTEAQLLSFAKQLSIS